MAQDNNSGAQDREYDAWGKQILEQQTQWQEQELGDSKHQASVKAKAKTKPGQAPPPEYYMSPVISRLLRAINFDVMTPAGKRYGDLNCVYRHPTSGGQVFIGGIGAATQLKVLQAHNITGVVNCQDPSTRNYFEKDKSTNISYLRFPIAHWWRKRSELDKAAGVLAFYQPYFSWVDQQIVDGKNVLVHCLAGAHRAGTAGISYVMYAGKLNRADATTIVQRQRPVVCPIGTFPDLLKRLDAALAPQRPPPTAEEEE